MVFAAAARCPHCNFAFPFQNPFQHPPQPNMPGGYYPRNLGRRAATNPNMGLFSFICGLLTIAGFWFPEPCWILGSVGIGMGVVGLRQSKPQLALAGVVCSGLGLLLNIIAMIAVAIRLAPAMRN